MIGAGILVYINLNTVIRKTVTVPAAKPAKKAKKAKAKKTKPTTI